jgi:hypothetical protein
VRVCLDIPQPVVLGGERHPRDEQPPVELVQEDPNPARLSRAAPGRGQVDHLAAVQCRLP